MTLARTLKRKREMQRETAQLHLKKMISMLRLLLGLRHLPQERLVLRRPWGGGWNCCDVLGALPKEVWAEYVKKVPEIRTVFMPKRSPRILILWEAILVLISRIPRSTSASRNISAKALQDCLRSTWTKMKITLVRFTLTIRRKFIATETGRAANPGAGETMTLWDLRTVTQVRND